MRLKNAMTSVLVIALGLLLVQPALANQDIVCESKDYRYQYCPIADHGYVEMTRQLSRERCVQGQTWDWDRNGVWVDDGCRAEFTVESEVHKKHHRAAKAAGLVLGAALLGALVDNADHNDKYKYTDERYQGPRHRSYVPGWMVGRFQGYNPDYGAIVELDISSDGRVRAEANGRTFSGYINDERLHVGDSVFDVDRVRNGFVTSQVGHRHNEVQYLRQR